ncbi:MAG: HPr family phosphocarrier protein [Clostridia bacterium]|nr:HPr family phosphocarrier protein [Clostridia bacterium]MBQ5956693.1 HPr family phosphocarrier protein [Clostridia bacterium]MBQ6003976.1 HPr family phosphocarrier protein [Clostridia bacterium]MBR0438464.1 HPr family phosphocarrier protein [Clostridia bacterium]MBR3563665.1 HPr family phosphocarrier protein [Clostridia bacterium]
MLYKDIEIEIPDGLHPKTSVELTQLANSFESQLLLEFGNKMVNAKSIMGMLTLSVPAGETITLMANGKDEEEAVKKITEFFNDLTCNN